MKVVLALQHELLPKTLHAEEPSPHIAWEGSGLSLLQDARQWKRGERIRRAGVSGFGISGTNAHVVIEEAPAPFSVEPPAVDVPYALPLLVSGRDEAALRAQAQRLREWLQERSETRFVDVVHTSALHRTHLDERAVVMASDASSGIEALAALAHGQRDARVVRGQAGARGKVVFVYPGQGSQWLGMGKALLEQSEVFAQSVRECDAALLPWTGWSVLSLLRGEQAAELPPDDRVDAVQTALFAMSVGLSALWRSLGLEPSAVVGHSQGEVAAAVVSGALTLQDGARVVAARAHAVRQRCGDGGMLLVERGVAEVEERLKRYGSALSIAAVNTSSSTVVSGESGALLQLKSELESSSVFCRVVNVDYASHSAQMDVLLPGLSAELSSLSPRAGEIPFYSTVENGHLSGQELDGSYWCRNLREPVRFDRALSQLLEDGHGVFVEVSAHPVLGVALRSASEAAGGVVIGSISRDQGDLSALLRGLGELHAQGCAVEWRRVLGGYGGRRVSLPTYAFQRERYWREGGKAKSDARSMGLSAVEHPLLGAMTSLADADGYLFSSRLSLREQPWLADHAVQGTVLVPGTGMLELALHAGRAVGLSAVRELMLGAPLVLTAEAGVQLQLSVGAADEAGERSVALYSRVEEGTWVQNATGVLSASSGHDASAQFEELRAWPVPGSEAVELEGLYPRLEAMGLHYGPAFQGLVELRRAGQVAYGRVVLPDVVKASADDYGLHPALLDAALHSLGLGLGEQEPQILLPFSWSDVELHARGASELRVRAELHVDESGESSVSLTVSDGAGEPVASVGALRVRQARLDELQRMQGQQSEHLYHIEFQPVALETVAEVTECAVLGGDGALANLLGVEWHADLPSLLAQASDGRLPRRVIVDATNRAIVGEVASLVHASTAHALSLLQALLSDALLSESELVWVTSSAVECGPDWDVADLVHAPLWGLLRAARSEHVERVLRLVDIGGPSMDRELLSHGISATREPELALRGGVWLAARLCAARSASREGTLELRAPMGRWQLAQREKGRLDSFELVAAGAGAPLGAQEVRVSIRASGMNFRDALNALDMVSAPALGFEFAGVVLEVGADVTNVSVGERVMGLGFAFASEVRTEAQLVTAIPARLSFEQAATVPLVYLTALYAFEDLGELAAGDKVLVHAAAGGVGMAAVQLARAAGAEVFGTASEGKWWSLRAQGMDEAHIASSRDLSFEQKVLEATGGAGVDVVLNALTKEYVDASLRLLPRGGRFLEMGKLDVRDAGEVRRQHPGVRYVVFDLMEAGLPRISVMLEKLARLLSEGVVQPLPFAAYDVRQAPAAFRFLAQGKHVGKLVLQMPRALAREGTVLITGGTGELGSALAEHLVSRHGVKHLLLTSRRGGDAPGSAELIAKLLELGAASVDVVACDVTVRSQVAAVLAQIPREHPLTGLFHLSAVLDDGVLQSQTAERLSAVLAPKVDGAWHLHELTSGQDLSCFVMFSSAAGTMGSAGQSNYAAANTFMDALAAYRKKRGLAGTSLAWGLWQPSGAGLTGRLKQADLARMARSGVAALSQAQGLALLDAALARPEPQLMPTRLELGTLQRAFEQAGTVPALWSALLRPSLRKASASRSDSNALRARLSALPESERLGVVLELVQGEVALVLGLAGPSAVLADKELMKLGLDSLMAVELRNRLSALAGIKLPATLAFDYPTPAAIAGWLLKQAFGELTAVRVARKPVLASGSLEPIAIVSMACRLPAGIDRPESYWQLLEGGMDAVESFPPRWDGLDVYDPNPDAVGKSYAREGGFVHEVELFDARFFGTSAREARSMDPQQRLLLETTWEALERAGIQPLSLNESLTGVYVGCAGSDYSLAQGGGLEALDGYVGMGSATSVLSGRVSYVLGLQGPALTVDTACSSSLTAIHLACTGLRQRECNLAVAGGVTVMSTPSTFVEFSRLRAMAPDGRCKSFSAQADGAGWGEGCGVLVLKRLSDAQRDGDQVLALVRGSAVNQDGRSQGLSAPNGPSQQRVIQDALSSCELTPSDIDAVEAHGTGTTLGDPIEAGALSAVFGPGRMPEQPVYLGSSKSNIGHTQAAAGVTGVMKMVLALQHELLPKTLHAEEPSPHIAWEGSGLSLLQDARQWKRGERVRRAGVSSFGISGTNAHVVIEEAPAQAEAEAQAVTLEREEPALQVLLLSGRDESALRAQAEHWRAWLVAHPQQRLADVVHSAALHRTHFEARAALVVSSAAECEEGLSALAAGRSHASVVTGRQKEDEKLAVLFTGQGSQRSGMGRELYEQLPTFRAALDELDAALAPWVGCSIREVMFAAQSAQLDQTQYTQPALFALEVALYRQWQSWGVKPRAVAGHSVGELSAAHVAGVLSLADAAKLVSARGRLMQGCRSDGAMASLEASEQEVLAELASYSEVEVAGLNGPTQTVVSGTSSQVEALMRVFQQRGRRVRALSVSHAFHSAHMDAMLEQYASVAQSCTYHEPALPVVSLASGEQAQGTELCTWQYWVQQARVAVRFLPGMRTLEALGIGQYLECGPDGVLSALGAQCVSESSRFVPSMRAGQPETRAMLVALGSIHSQGIAVDLRAVVRDAAGHLVNVPTYAFQRERYWREGGKAKSDARSMGLSAVEHPLLGAMTSLADGDGYLFSSRLSLREQPWLADHAVQGTVLVPGTGILELALHAGRAVGLSAVRELTLEQPLVLTAEAGVQLQLSVGAADEAGERSVALYSRVEEGTWVQNATGVLSASSAHDASVQFEELRAWPAPGSEAVEIEGMYPRLEALGLHYGPAFQGLVELRRAGQVAYGRVVLPDVVKGSADDYGLHPALFDAALHSLGLGLGEQEPQILLPFSWSDVELHARGASELRVRAELQVDESGQVTASLTVSDGAGEPVASVGALRMRQARPEELQQLQGQRSEHLYRVEFQPVALEAVSELTEGAVLGGDGALAKLLGVEWYTDLPSLLAQANDGRLPKRVIVDATERSNADEVVSLVHASTAQALSLLQALLSEVLLSESELVWVTSSAVECGSDWDVSDLVHAPLWGLLRAARSEHAERVLRLVDIGDTSADREILSHGVSATREPELALRGGVWLAARLRAARSASPEGMIEPRTLSREGTVLITGGTGELGSALAEHLVSRHGIRHLLLTSRRGADAPGSAELTAKLLSLGAASAKVVACDVTVRSQVAAVLAQVPSEQPLTGVFHLSAVLDDAVLQSQTAERLSAVLAPKVDGAWHLHELTAEQDLSCFVLFSSAAGTMGSAGQSNYAAANAFMDALAAYRKKRGLPGTSLAWGLWQPSGTGLTGRLKQTDLARMARSGIVALSQRQGLALLDTALTRPESQLMPIRLELGTLQRAFEQVGAVPALWSALVRPSLRKASASRSDASALRARLSALPEAERLSVVLEMVQSEIATLLGLSGPNAVLADKELMKLGLDSLMAVELRNRMSALTGKKLPATLAFDYPTPAAIAALVSESLSVSLADVAKDAVQITSRDLRSFADMLLAATPAQLARHGLVSGLLKLRGELGVPLPSSDQDAAIDLSDDERLISFLEDKFGAEL